MITIAAGQHICCHSSSARMDFWAMTRFLLGNRKLLKVRDYYVYDFGTRIIIVLKVDNVAHTGSYTFVSFPS